MSGSTDPLTKKPTWKQDNHYTRPDGSKVIIQDDSAGHQYGQGGGGEQGPNLKIRLSNNTRAGSISGSYEHYSY
ncbi:hypothetical protein JHU04_004256 [Brenneria sp. 4F2]|nr:hypothetical protein [Brenneria bubanii]